MGRKRKRRAYDLRIQQLENHNEIFSCEPDQVLALRKALGWCRLDLGRLLGLHLNLKRHDCWSIARWEKGACRPHRAYALRMVVLSEMFRDEYLRNLQEIRLEKAKTENAIPPSTEGLSEKSDIPCLTK